MPKRFLKYAADTHEPLLAKNPRHMYAHRHAIHIYDSNAIYSMIPKNACSTLRLSIAVANGAIRGPQDAGWIHLNNKTFDPALADLMRADYTFVILRCPFARLASCFLDKFVGETPETGKYNKALANPVDLDRLSFRSFCLSLGEGDMLTANIHWAPQTRFLVFDKYDDYFCVERFDVASKTLGRKIGLKIVDARPATRHGIDGLKRLPPAEKFSDVAIRKLRELRAGGETPDPVSLYDAALTEFVGRTYAEDVTLYRNLFPGLSLFGP
jgi:hypothetical protein